MTIIPDSSLNQRKQVIQIPILRNLDFVRRVNNRIQKKDLNGNLVVENRQRVINDE